MTLIGSNSKFAVLKHDKKANSLKADGSHSSQPALITAGPKDVPRNEQVGRLILVVKLLLDTGFCSGDMQVAIARYLRALTPAEFKMLRLHLPNIKDLKDSTEWASHNSALHAIASLGTNSNITVAMLEQALNNVIAKLDQVPDSFDGTDGWFLWLASNLAKNSISAASKSAFSDTSSTTSTTTTTSAPRKNVSAGKSPATLKNTQPEGYFWLPELENALFLAQMIRFRIKSLVWRNETDPKFKLTFSPTLRAIAKEAWYAFFGMFFSTNHFENVCSCEDQTLVMHSLGPYRGSVSPAAKKDAAEVEKMERLLQRGRPDTFRVRDLYSVRYEKSPRLVSKTIFYTLHWENKDFVALRGQFREAMAEMGKRSKGDCPEGKAK
ncbi:hypothetical protein B0H63DRAFT_474241 [Podospora didyma]|uniref:Uncharacterized protein n=1 Tax=Podospora didyma TaxID=330526 RepID=A0AAE0U0B3_9PEZI|nr:hypothetical protein B0H63DRAFT_474241 [Podospora didyma]